MTKLLLVRDSGAGRETLDEYRARGGYAGLEKARGMSQDALIAEVEASGLRGRGGAAFPVARKWSLAAGAADKKYVVANGGEHEPGSAKDRFLMASYPHAVLEGVAICAHATGATEAVIYLIEDMTDAIEAVEAALEEAGDTLGGVAFSIHRAPTTYVAGEETAALRSIEGDVAKPRKKPPYPGEAGLHGKPTTVNNVETLAHVPGIVREGAAAFRAIGVEGDAESGSVGSSGTMIFTLAEGQVERPGLYELPFGATFRELIEGCGGGIKDGKELRAILPALSSAFLPASAIDLSMDHDTLRAHGSSLGCGGVHLLTTDDDLLAKALEIARFFADEQCGQCPPCRMETNTFVSILEKMTAGEEGAHLEQMEKIAKFTARKGFCSLIEMAAAPVLSAVRML